MAFLNININDFNYNLPETEIAKYPLPNRSDSKLLIYNKGKIYDKHFKDLPSILQKNDLLIFNTTKVIRARLIFRKLTGAKIEIFCLEPHAPSDYEQIFQETESCKWKCAVGNLKKWKQGKLIAEYTVNGKKISLEAKRVDGLNNYQIIELKWNNKNITFGDILEHAGKTPVPPYLKRDSEEIDKNRYQTVYSEQKGSVAAPTAGLHFTEELIKKLKDKGIKTANLTLHVGAGTFKPVKSDFIKDHEMHTEHFIVGKELILSLMSNKNNNVAVGTTSVRTIESLYLLGVKLQKDKNPEALHLSQWEAYNLPLTLSPKEALTNILSYMDKNKTEYFEASTQIMIVPGYKFKMTDKLITNFHQPKSTLLLLVDAFIGNDRKKVYDYALKNNFRFLSYGDSSILIP
ncbi:MAG: S-adenosylmethionine:tRNA ribosyltransferase-isomerase [Chlorobi bacterium]|nr:S-adenosylmethionine:tRNA ribosyltransferase-isomerase [Chlorobiota bacterium]